MSNEEKTLKIGQYVCTRRQKRIFDNIENEGVKIFQRLVWLGIEARKAWVSLPHENEEGEKVVHGANKVMHEIEEMYFSAAQSLALHLPEKDGRDWFPWMFLRNARSRSGLPEWMQWLIDKNDGNVPTGWSNEDVKSDDVVMQERASRKRALNIFRQTGRDVDSIGREIDDESMDNYPGRVYLEHLWLERWVDDRNGVAPPNGEPTWLLTIGNYQSCGTLEQLEEELFDYAVSEELVTRSGW